MFQSRKRANQRTSRKPSRKSVITEPVVVTTLPQEGFVAEPTVLAIFAIKRSTMWWFIKTGRFPKPYKTGPFGRFSRSVWDVNELRAHMDKIRAGVTALK